MTQDFDLEAFQHAVEDELQDLLGGSAKSPDDVRVHVRYRVHDSDAYDNQEAPLTLPRAFGEDLLDIPEPSYLQQARSVLEQLEILEQRPPHTAWAQAHTLRERLLRLLQEWEQDAQQREQEWKHKQRAQDQLLAGLLASQVTPQAKHPFVREGLIVEPTALLKQHLDTDRLRADENRQRAKEIIERKDIHELLCPALKSAGDDVYDVAKIITPLLAGAVIAGTIAVPLVPVLFASIALMISRMGLASWCAEYNKKDSNKK